MAVPHFAIDRIGSCLYFCTSYGTNQEPIPSLSAIANAAAESSRPLNQRPAPIMNTQPEPLPPVIENSRLQTAVVDELTRVKIFLGIQAFFLAVSVFTGGFNFKLWSMLDTALMIQSIGVTALVVVLEEARQRRLAFRVAIVLYLLAVLDMGINVCVSGVVGWKA
jgi:hypothetical protein